MSIENRILNPNAYEYKRTNSMISKAEARTMGNPNVSFTENVAKKTGYKYELKDIICKLSNINDGLATIDFFFNAKSQCADEAVPDPETLPEFVNRIAYLASEIEQKIESVMGAIE